MVTKRWFVLVAALALVAGACGSDDDDEGTTADTSGGARAESIVVTGDEYSFGVDEEIEGGFVEVEYKNEGKLVHEAAFIKVEGDKSQDEVIKAVKAAATEDGAPIEPFIGVYLAGGLADLDGGETATSSLSLPAGDYYLVCALTDADSLSDEELEARGEDAPPEPTHMEQGMIEKVTVTGPDTVTLPEADATVAAKEYTFDIDGLKAGKQEVLFRNDGAELHMAAVMEFAEGVDEAEAEEALAAFAGPPTDEPPSGPEPEEAGFSGIFNPDGGGLFELDAKSGRVYAFVCFIQDRAGGPPHVAKGMSKLVTIE